ncbi:hypothetical protein [Salinarimonas rosea]|uniref:hypothetical protein n=1 Tax=Salinarimonas rosea TaxID=552063 RepID=UPI00041FC722|nr:hypothetical protein [Salinarimonas rosea]
MPASLIDVLAEIDPRRSAPARLGAAEAVREEPSAPRPEIAPAFAPRGPAPEEIEARIAEAAAQAAAAAREEAQAHWAQVLEHERARAAAAGEAALAACRTAWARDEGERLAEGVREGLAAIEERIAEAASRALAPLLEAAARDRALTALAASIATLLRAEPTLVLAASGPADLGEALLARLGDVASAVRFTPSETTDVVVVGDDVVIETRLSEWARRVAAEAA